MKEAQRISKLLAQRGLCSRREADSYLEKGWVKVDGRTAQLGEKAFEYQTITLEKKAQIAQRQRVTILLNKPVGYVSGQAEEHYKPAIVLIKKQNQYDAHENAFDSKHLRGLAPAGRLDIDSHGLLVLTQDGRLARKIIGEDSEIEKEYLVRVTGKIREGGLKLLNHGLCLDGYTLKPAKVTWQNENQLKFILTEGKKRQIRRMCELVGLKVTGLKRVRIGQVKLSNLPLGQWRYLKENEKF